MAKISRWEYFPDPLQVWVSSTAGTNHTAFDIQLGSFTGSTTGWQQYKYVIPVSGNIRFAVRYYTTNGGPSGSESDYIGLDYFEVVTGGAPCPVGAPTNPSPANGAINVPVSGNTATWTNGAGTTNVEVWFGEVGNLVQVYNGAAIASFSLAPVEPLNYFTDYGWRIVCKDATCSTQGPTWTFTTVQDPNLQVFFCDDFTAGSGNWTITNDGGTAGCIWEVFNPPFPNLYTLPPTSSGAVFAADVDDCGTSGTTMLTTATITTPIDASMYQNVWIEFDNDWNILDAQDEAHVEVSTNGGTTWVGVWDQIGVDIRNTHEIVDITSQVALTTFLVRFRSSPPRMGLVVGCR